MTLIAFLISLIVFLLVVAVLLWIVRAILALMPEPFARFGPIIYGIVALILLLMFLGRTGVLGTEYRW